MSVFDRLCDQYDSQGWDIPDEKFNPLWPESFFYFQAWSALDTDRPISMGFAPIPWTAIYWYAMAHGELADLDILTRMIWALDKHQARVEQEKREFEERHRGRPSYPYSPGSDGRQIGRKGRRA